MCTQRRSRWSEAYKPRPVGTLIEGEEVSNLSLFPPQTRGVRNYRYPHFKETPFYLYSTDTHEYTQDGKTHTFNQACTTTYIPYVSPHTYPLRLSTHIHSSFQNDTFSHAHSFSQTRTATDQRVHIHSSVAAYRRRPRHIYACVSICSWTTFIHTYQEERQPWGLQDLPAKYQWSSANTRNR